MKFARKFQINIENFQYKLLNAFTSLKQERWRVLEIARAVNKQKIAESNPNNLNYVMRY